MAVTQLLGADSTHQFHFLVLWCQILRFLLQLEGRFTFPTLLSTSSNTVVAVSSPILSPKSLRKSHGYRVWKSLAVEETGMSDFLSSTSFSEMHCLLVTVWLGWLNSYMRELGCSDCRLMQSRSSGRNILQQLRRWMRIQVCFLATWGLTQNDSLASLLGTADTTLSTENVPWTHVLSEWLGWPHPPQNKKKENSQYNQTQYASAMFFL